MQQKHSEPFVITPQWVVDADISPEALKLHLVLTSYADNETGVAYPTRETLAERVGRAPKSISRYIQELIDIGALEVTVRRNQKPNLYRLIKSKPARLSDKNSGNSKSQSDISTGHTCPGGTAQLDTHVPLHRDTGVPLQLDTHVPLTRPTELDPDELDADVANAPSDTTEAVEAEIVDTDEQPEDKPTTQTLIAEWLDNRTMKPPKSLIGHLSREIKKLLDEGFDYDLVRRAVGLWHQKNLHPSVLPSILDEVQKGQNSTFAGTAAERRLLAGQARDKALSANTAPTPPPVDPFQLEAQHRRRQLETGGNHV